ncbi:hypothetical protein ACRRTK_013244 [Alexandromys fortis]
MVRSVTGGQHRLWETLNTTRILLHQPRMPGTDRCINIFMFLKTTESGLMEQAWKQLPGKLRQRDHKFKASLSN